MVNETMAKVMNSCNEYFAVLCERVTCAEVDSKAVKARFKGKYTPGMLLRVHGAYTLSYGDFREGELYEVESFDGKTLTLDHELHTKAPNLFIATLEPTREFLRLCGDIEAWEQKHAASKGLASESIDGYSYSVATDANGRSGFEAAFADELKPYRCARPTPLYYARAAQAWQ